MMNKFMKIYEDISNQIQEGTLPAGSLLPSENDLADTFQTSRETIRKALKILSEDGYIHKVQGKGSIVLDVKKFAFPISGLVSFKELSKRMGHRAKTHVEILQEIFPDESLKEQLKLSIEDTAWEIHRVREIDKERVIFDKDFIVKKMVPVLNKAICQNSIYEYIEEELGLTISFAKKEITVETPTEEDRSYLDLEGFHNIVVVKNFVYLDDTSLFQYTESRHRPDKFRFVDFARRK
ncbi:transcriptional regulator, GntR family [Bacillus sp. OV322]|uniref:trehalose operon repressor n=1 Tax=Bacillus sp. OV322 TaxID=1882764 RepID=UPI0008E19929|nr:trehalose operon repressor [Bacillus sp. OV322]SFC87055.1 transcriptional regulator, GntR family [Bacillus sp. OV322]